MKKVLLIILTLAMLVGVLGVSNCFASQDIPQVKENITLTEKKEEPVTSKSSKIFKIINGGIILILGAVSLATLKYIKALKGQIEDLEKLPELSFDNCMALESVDERINVLAKQKATRDDAKCKWFENSWKVHKEQCDKEIKKANDIYEIYKPLLNAINGKWKECVLKKICTGNEKTEDVFKAAMDMYMEMKSPKSNER